MSAQLERLKRKSDTESLRQSVDYHLTEYEEHVKRLDFHRAMLVQSLQQLRTLDALTPHDALLLRNFDA